MIFPGERRGMVGATGFEPATARPPAVCATRLRHAPIKTHFKCYASDSQAPSPLLSIPKDWHEIVLVSFFPPMRVHCNDSSARHSHDHNFFVRERKYCVQARFRSLRFHKDVYAPHRFSEEDRYSCILRKPSPPIEVVRFEVC